MQWFNTAARRWDTVREAAPRDNSLGRSIVRRLANGKRVVLPVAYETNKESSMNSESVVSCRRRVLARAALLLAMSAFVLPAGGAEDAELDGLWEGTIGNLLVIACLDSSHRSAYYYQRDPVEITLREEGPEWVESINEVATGRWQFSEIARSYLRGRWSNPEGKRELPIRLSRVNTREQGVAPCDNRFFKLDFEKLPDAKGKNDRGLELLKLTLNRAHTIAAGEDHSAAITADGSLWVWGNNRSGLLGDGTNTYRRSPVKVGSDFAQVVAAYDKTAAIKKDGSLWTWYQVKDISPDRLQYSFMMKKVGIGFSHVAVGGSGSPGYIAVGQDGSLWAEYLADGGVHTPALFKIGSGFVRAALGQTGSGTTYAAALRTDGTLWAWAYDGTLPLDNNINEQRDSPVKIGSDFTDVTSNWGRMIGTKKDGTLWEWKGDGAWMGADSKKHYLSVTEPVQLGHRFTQVVHGRGQTFALKSDGSLWAWGRNLNFSSPLGDGTLQARKEPVLIGVGFIQVAVGTSHSLAMKTDGTVWTWGAHDVLGHSFPELRLPRVKIGQNFVKVATGPAHTLAIKNGGMLWAWGKNDHGQLGTGSVGGIHPKPVQVGRHFIQIAAGRDHSLGIKKDRTLWAWGNNEYGQLGDGTLHTRTAPVLVGRDFSQVAASGSHTIAIKSDGTLWVWGSHSSGRELSLDIDDPSIKRRRPHRPVQIGRGFLRVVTSKQSTLAIDVEGAMWQWMANDFVKRDRLTAHSQRPAKIGNGFVDMAIGDGRYFAIKHDGALWAWGSTASGKLGVGDNASPDLTSPVQIGSGFAKVTAGNHDGEHSVAVKTDGTLWGWGYNDKGQLADGTNNHSYNIPVQIGTGFAQVSVNRNHTLAIKTDGTLWGWGDTAYGQLGTGQSIPLRPVQRRMPIVYQNAAGYIAGVDK